MKLLVHKLNINLCKLKLVSQWNNTHHVPSKNTMLANFKVIHAVWDKSILREHCNNFVNNWLLLSILSWLDFTINSWLYWNLAVLNNTLRLRFSLISWIYLYFFNVRIVNLNIIDIDTSHFNIIKWLILLQYITKF